MAKQEAHELVVSREVDEPKALQGWDSWEELEAGADTIVGADLAKDALMDQLVGVPFLIHKLTFRKGILRPGGIQAAYASVEAVIAPLPVLRKRLAVASNARQDLGLSSSLDDLPFDPMGMVIFNDGSTGIYRQLVAYLAGKEIITLPEPVVPEGSYGQSTYDLPPRGWSAIRSGTPSAPESDPNWVDYEINVRIQCPRGLRVSDYQNDFNPSGSRTRYLG